MEIEIQSDVLINPDAQRPLKVDLYLPQNEGLRPAVILVFGGGWSTGDKTQQKAYGIKLAKAGFVCLAADYRLSSEAPWPAQRDDVAAAVRWLYDQAAVYRVDPQRIAISGNSSGGHVALMVAAASERVAAVCAFYPPTDLPDLYGKGGKDVLDPLMNGAASPENLWAASPVAHADKIHCPVLLLSGDADVRVPVSQTYALQRALIAKGAPVETHVFTGLGHAFDFDRDMAVLASSLMIRFFTAAMPMQSAKG